MKTEQIEGFIIYRYMITYLPGFGLNLKPGFLILLLCFFASKNNGIVNKCRAGRENL